ncbi:MAG: hypothetical protein EBS07_05755 [Sphingobacteriia bacterium]|nr:hypothetical protein [Sphingobacteriia bacterium]
MGIKINSGIITLIASIGIAIIYFSFPFAEPSNDAIAYAAAVKWGYDFWNPHHLLHPVPARIVLYLFLLFDSKISPATALISWNILSAIAIFNFLIKYLQKIRNWDYLPSLFAGLITLFSFGVWRFAIEGEAYLAPLAISVWAWYLNQSNQKTLGSILWGLAILFHQEFILFPAIIYGMEIIRFPKNTLKHIIITGIVVVSGYSIIYLLYTTHINFAEFLFRDFVQGNASFFPNYKALLLIPISLIRTWFQIHGFQSDWSAHHPEIIVSEIIMFLICLVWIFYKRKTIHFYPIYKTLNASDYLFLGFFLFSAWFGGNAEFMVPLTILIWTSISARINFSIHQLLPICIFVFFWNLGMGIIPKSLYHWNPESQIVQQYQTFPNNTWWVVQDHNTISNGILLSTGIYPERIMPSPSYYQQKFGSTDILYQKIDSLLKSGNKIFTDCPGRPSTMSRSAWMIDDSHDFWQQFFIQQKYIIHCYSKDFPISEINLRNP